MYRPFLDKLMEQGIPLVPFPKIQRCLGLSQKDSSMEIFEGYVLLAYDFQVKPSHQDCLFKIEETVAEKELRWAKMAKKSTKNHSFLEKMAVIQNVIEQQLIQLELLRPEAPELQFPDWNDIVNLDRLMGSPF